MCADPPSAPVPWPHAAHGAAAHVPSAPLQAHPLMHTQVHPALHVSSQFAILCTHTHQYNFTSNAPRPTLPYSYAKHSFEENGTIHTTLNHAG